MRGAIMQPYFFPYLGYFQIINLTEVFILYDKIQFTKKGWIHRNRILSNKKDLMLTLSLKKDSDYLDIYDRKLSDDFMNYNSGILRKISGNYSNAPYFHEVLPLISSCLFYRSNNLFDFIYNSIKEVMEYLGIKNNLKIYSEIEGVNLELKGQNKVIDICTKANITDYINPIGGVSLYDKNEFMKFGINLKFHKIDDIKYKQIGNDFFANLSIIDVLMFNSKDSVNELLKKYTLK